MIIKTKKYKSLGRANKTQKQYMDTPIVQDFKGRLLNEKSELDDRLGKLNAFLKGDKVASIDPVQITLLNIQSKAMETYSQCLLERISRL